jgi:hypothetical protein
MKGLGCLDKIFTLKLIIEKCLSHQRFSPQTGSHEKALDPVDRRALRKEGPIIVWYTRYIH